MQEEERSCVPLVVVSPEHAIEDLQNLFQENDYFGFESEKVKHFLFTSKDSFAFRLSDSILTEFMFLLMSRYGSSKKNHFL